MKKLITISGLLILAAVAVQTIDRDTKAEEEVAIVQMEETKEEARIKSEIEGAESLDELLSHPEVLKAAADNSLKDELQARIDHLSKTSKNSPYIQTMRSTKDGILVGYNYNITKNGISERVASAVMEKVVEDDRKKLEKYSWFNKLDKVRQGAVLNLTFNMGIGGFMKFDTTIANLERGNYEAAAKSLLYTSRGKTLYHRQVKGRAREVAEIIRTGVEKESSLATLKRHEGFRKFPYRDSRGIWTVGYGINLEHRGFDTEESLMLLAMAAMEDDTHKQKV